MRDITEMIQFGNEIFRPDMVLFARRMPKDLMIAVLLECQEDCITRKYNSLEHMNEAWEELRIALHRTLGTIQIPDETGGYDKMEEDEA